MERVEVSWPPRLIVSCRQLRSMLRFDSLILLAFTRRARESHSPDRHLPAWLRSSLSTPLDHQDTPGGSISDECFLCTRTQHPQDRPPVSARAIEDCVDRQSTNDETQKLSKSLRDALISLRRNPNMKGLLPCVRSLGAGSSPVSQPGVEASFWCGVGCFVPQPTAGSLKAILRDPV
jgi:hypothetical protein